MNRVKVWIFTLLVVVAGLIGAGAVASSMRADDLAALDARLASAAAHVAASTRAIARDAGAAVALLSRDDTLAAALRSREAAPPPPSAPRARKGKAAAAPPAPEPAAPDEARMREAAREEVAVAEKTLGFTLPGGTVVRAGNRAWLAGKGEASEAEGEAMGFLRTAVAGQPRRGFLRLDGAVWYGVAGPVGDGAAAEVLVPLDEAWARTVATAAGVDVTLSATGVKPVSTARPADVAALQAATRGAGAADVGRTRRIDVSLGAVRLPKLPDPLGGGPALRARAVPLEGGVGSVVLSIPAARIVEGSGAFFYRTAAALALVLLVGFLVGLLVAPAEPSVQVPQALYAAAARIEKGDFGARAPQLAGKLGTVAAALNKAAEIAGPAQAAAGAPPPAGGELESPGQPALAEPGGFEFPPRPARPEPGGFELPPRPAQPEPSGFELSSRPPAAAVRPEPSEFELPGRPPPGASPEPLPARPPPGDAPEPFPARTATLPAVAPPPAAAAAAPAFEVDEETHWQQVFQDFLRTRQSCGEPTEALTYEKFRQKLQANKAQLVAKYSCKTVRFQVYVKEGKAALKATPVK